MKANSSRAIYILLFVILCCTTAVIAINTSALAQLVQNPSGEEDPSDNFSKLDASREPFGAIIRTVPMWHWVTEHYYTAVDWGNGEILQTSYYPPLNNNTLYGFNPQTGSTNWWISLPFNGEISDVEFDGTYLWVAEFSPNIIRKITLAGVELSNFVPQVNGILKSIAWDGANLWVGTTTTTNVTNLYKMTTTGTILQTWNTDSAVGNYRGSTWISAAPSGGELAVVDASNNTIKRLSITGSTVTIADQCPSPAALSDGGCGLGYDGWNLWHCSRKAAASVDWYLGAGFVPQFFPAAPNNFAIANNGTALIASLSWTLPTSTPQGFPLNPNYPIHSVVVKRDNVVIATLDSTATNYTDTVPSAFLYHYQVFAVNDSGNGLPASDSAWIGLDIPGPVTNLEIQLEGSTSAALSWINPDSGMHQGYFPADSISGYIIHRYGSDTTTFNLLGLANNFLDTTITVLGSYYYGVVAYNSSGQSLEALSNSIWLGLDIPGPVTNLEIQLEGSTSAALSWINPDSGMHQGYFPADSISGYIIHRYGPDTATVNLPGLQNDYLDTTLALSGWYHYGVIVYNSSGQGLEALSDSVRFYATSISGPINASIGPGTYQVIGPISVASTDSLIIAPGTTFLFSGDYDFDINGYLYAVGTESDSIKFMPETGNPFWQGLDFGSSASDSSKLGYCFITGSHSSALILSGVDLAISHCLISGNLSNWDGGGAIQGSTNGTISDCIFQYNTGNMGAAFRLGGHSVISNCIFRHNTTTEATGHILEIAGYPTITHCTIVNNNGSGTSGGYGTGGNRTLIDHCTIQGNTGVGINAPSYYSSNPIIKNSIIEGNASGGAILNPNASISYSDCYNNGSTNLSGISGAGQLVMVNVNGDSCDVFHNILMNPQFVDPEAGDFHLQENSPCIDAGDPNSPLDPDGSITDMGVYYYVPLSPYRPAAPTDFTVSNNGPVNRASLSWNNPTQCLNGNPLITINSIKINRNGQFIASLNGNPGQAMAYDNEVDTAGYYHYAVYAVNDSGNGLSASTTPIPWIGLDIPGSLTNLTGVGGIMVAYLTWMNPNPDSGMHGGYCAIAGYTLRRILGSDTATFNIYGNQTGYTDSLTIPGAYRYGVLAFNSAGSGPESFSDVIYVGTSQGLGGPLSGNIGPGTFHIYDDIWTNDGDSLTLAPGTCFRFDGNYSFINYGSLVAVGNENDSIQFIPDSPAITWRGIHLRGYSTQGCHSVLKYCYITGSNWTAGLVIINNALCSSEVSHCTITDNSGAGMYLVTEQLITVDSCLVSGNHDSGIQCHGNITSGATEIKNSQIINNTRSGGFIEGGGGICSESVNNLLVEDCTISNNSAGNWGGGLYLLKSDSVRIEGCTISSNSTGGWGGGITTDVWGGDVFDCHLMILNCIINNNTANYYGGGIDIYEVPNNSNIYTISGCLIDGNSAKRGGGIYLQSYAAGTISNCTISNNHANGDFADGGGICCQSSTNFTVSDCRIFGNTAIGYGGGGGGISGDVQVIEHCLIYGNSATYGGGGLNKGYHITNCTIVSNSAGGVGGGIFCLSGNYITNTIVAGNTSPGGGVYCGTSGVYPVHSDFYNNGGGNFTGEVPAGVGQIITTNVNGDSCDQYYNIFLNPNFYATTGDSAFYLTAISPCIDAGDPTTPLDPDGTTADIGVYYFHHLYSHWLLTLTCTGQSGSAPNIFYLSIGGHDSTQFTPSPPPPPQYMCWTELYDSTWSGPYSEMMYQWEDSSEYMWRLKVDPNGNVPPPVSRTSVFTWDPNDLPGSPPGYAFYIVDDSNRVVVYDMSVQDSLAVTGTNEVFYTIKYGLIGTPYVFNLAQYWNLISLPVTPVNNNLNYLFPNALVAYAFTGGTYQPVTQLLNGKAYWLYVPTAQNAAIYGVPLISYSTSVTPPWEMLGAVSVPAIPVVSPGSINIMYRFNQTYYQVPNLVMQPGLGYWVNLTSNTTNFTLGDSTDAALNKKELLTKSFPYHHRNNATDEDWELPITVTGQVGSAPNVFTAIIGGAASPSLIPAPPPPPQYLTYTQLYDTLWAGPYYEMTWIWPAANSLFWRLEIDPNGNVMPPISRTAIATWDPDNLPSQGVFFILDASTGDTVIADMRQDSTFSATGTQVRYYNLRWLSAVTPPIVDINLTPVNPPIQIPASGGSFNFNAYLHNNQSTTLNFDCWIMVRLPSGSWYGPVLGPVALTFPGGATITRLRSQTIPASAPAGSYLYQGYVGDYSAIKWDSSSFNFTKLTTGDGPSIGDWENLGESFEPYLIVPEVEIPESFAFTKAYPNPFNPITKLSFALPEPTRVKLAIYDLRGCEVAVLVDGWREAGYYDASWDAGNLASGIYFYRLQAGKCGAIGKMVLVK